VASVAAIRAAIDALRKSVEASGSRVEVVAFRDDEDASLIEQRVRAARERLGGRGVVVIVDRDEEDDVRG
jgi:hypothetical protein